jgi:hypothetical protein
MWMGFYKLIKTPPEILLKIAFLIELTVINLNFRNIKEKNVV